MLNLYNNHSIMYHPAEVVDKLKIKLHNVFESKAEEDYLKSIEDFEFFLHSFIISKLKKTDDGIYFNSEVKNWNRPSTLAQARVLLSFCMLHNNKFIFNSEYLIDNLKNYLLSLREQSGIFRFNQKYWRKQDEGIASIWALFALLKTYEITRDSRLLNEITFSLHALHNILIHPKNNLVHTLGDNFWCLNAASTYAMFAGQFLNYYFDDELVHNYIQAIELCLSKQTSVGYYPYSERMQGTYLLLYNPIIMFTLEKAINEKFISPELKNNVNKSLLSAKNYLLKQKDDNHFFVEPEQKKFSRYIISNITCLVALKHKLGEKLENQILKNVCSYLVDDELYLCRNERGKYFNGKLYQVADVLTTEVFYWLLTYFYD